MTTAVEEGSATVPPLHPYLSAGRAREGSVKCDVAMFRRPRFEVTQNVDKLFCPRCTGPNSVCLVTELYDYKSLTDALKLYEVFV